VFGRSTAQQYSVLSQKIAKKNVVFVSTPIEQRHKQTICHIPNVTDLPVLVKNV
jgi:hypothetical protein